jgi:xylulokinase
MVNSGEPAVIGVDLGTSSTKAVLMTTDGRSHGEARAEYRMHSSHSGWNENDPDDWRRAFDSVVAQLAAQARSRGLTVRAIGLVAQRDPFVLLDADGLPLRRAISWTDQRARSQTRRLRARHGDEELVTITGTRPIVGLGLTNLLWTKDEEPELWRRTRRAVSPKDYVLSGLVPRRATDVTTPTRALAFDIAAADWSDEILEPEGVPAEVFDPAALQPWDEWGRLGAEDAERLGVPVGTILAAGGADDQAATLGGGAAVPGEICLGTGTCSDWRLVLPSYAPDTAGLGDTAPHVVPDAFVREVTIDSAGSALRWFRTTICPELGYADIIDLALRAPRGSAGVRFYPFVDGGQRAPYYLDESSGVFFGITSHHGREHLARAVIEGIAFLYPRTWELLLRGRPDRSSASPLTIVDGEASSAPWNRIKADVLNHPLRATEVTEAAAVGGAILAGVAAGLYPSPAAAASAMVRPLTAVEPDPAGVAEYADIVADYLATFDAIEGAFSKGRLR